MPSRTDTVEVDFVAPRHLAGGGDPAWVTVPLHRGCGWSYADDPLIPCVLLSSPDQKALLRLEPEPDGQWWTLQHAAEPGRPAWYASFGGLTPVELIAAVTDALTDPAPTASAPSDPHECAKAAGCLPPGATPSSHPTPQPTSNTQGLRRTRALGSSPPRSARISQCGRPASAREPLRT